MKNLSDTQIKFLKLGTLFASAAPLIWVICDIYDNFNAKSQIGVVGDGFLLVFALYLFGITGSLLYSGDMARSLTDFLFYPRHYLKIPPVITTRQKGLIAAKKYQLAQNELIELRAEHPYSPDVALMLADLHFENFNSPETAIADILYYHSKRRLRYHHLNLRITLRCADFYTQLGKPQDAIELLKKECGVIFVYSKRERNVLLQRAEAIRESLN